MQAPDEAQAPVRADDPIKPGLESDASQHRVEGVELRMFVEQPEPATKMSLADRLKRSEQVGVRQRQIDRLGSRPPTSDDEPSRSR